MEQTMLKRKMYLAGEWVFRDKTIDVENPQNGEIIAQVPAASREDAIFAIKEGIKGAEIARNMPTYERISILNKVANWIEDRQSLFAKTIATEGSKTIREAKKKSFDASRRSASVRKKQEDFMEKRFSLISWQEMKIGLDTISVSQSG